MVLQQSFSVQGITTYDYILAVREQNEEFYDEADGLSSVTTTPQTSTETGFSGYNSSAGALALAGKRTVFCTPPRLFVDQDQVHLPTTLVHLHECPTSA